MSETLTDTELIDRVWEDWSSRFSGDVSAKYTPDDVDDDLFGIADLYLRGYEGTFEFLVSLQEDVVTNGKQLTPGAAKGVLNCMVADAKRTRGITGGGGGKPLKSIPEFGCYAVGVDGYVDLYRVKSWLPKDSDTELVMVEGQNVPDSMYLWGMVAVINPDTMTYNIRSKITDEVMRESARMLIESTPKQRVEYSKAYQVETGRDPLTNKVVDKQVAKKAAAKKEPSF